MPYFFRGEFPLIKIEGSFAVLLALGAATGILMCDKTFLRKLTLYMIIWKKITFFSLYWNVCIHVRHASMYATRRWRLFYMNST